MIELYSKDKIGKSVYLTSDSIKQILNGIKNGPNESKFSRMRIVKYALLYQNKYSIEINNDLKSLIISAIKHVQPLDEKLWLDSSLNELKNYLI